MASDSKISADSHLYLVDGSGYIFRAFHALPPLTRKSDGAPIGAVHGFTGMMMKLLREMKAGDAPTHFAVIFDASEKTFRKDLYADYKANRPPPPEDLVPQFPLIRDAVKAFGQPCIELGGYEADDIIATYARQAEAAGAKVTIVSSDKDLMQLVSDNIGLYDTMKDARIGADEVVKKFGVGPDKVVEVQSLIGDTSDNIPGVPGIGVKTAAQLIGDYGDLETLLARVEEIKQPKRRESLIEHAEAARISHVLATLKTDLDLELTLDDLSVKAPEPDALLDFMDLMEFRTLRRRAEADFAADGADIEMADDPAAADFEPDKYECVTTMDALEGWIDRCRAAGVMGVDTETDALDSAGAGLCGVSLAVGPNQACYIPLAHLGGDLAEGGGKAPDQLKLEDALAALKPLLEDPDVLKVGQNLIYDIAVLRRYGVEITPYDDTMLISYAQEGGLFAHGMDALSQRHLGHTPIPFKEVCGTGKNQKSFDQIQLEPATKYAAEDADVTLRLWHVLKPQLAANGVTAVYERLERPLPPIIAQMELHGIKVDRNALSRLSGDFAQRMAEHEAKAYEIAGRSFNLGSPKQIGEIMFGELGLPGGKKTKTGAWSTDAQVLEDLAAAGHELPTSLLEWRQYSKLKSTYSDALGAAINPKTGRVHTSFHLASTATGRISSSDPNLQNIPVRTEAGRKIREAFVPEDGNVLVSADYSQIELRILAQMAGIDALKTAFREGQDIHAMTASEMFGTPVEGMDPVIRRQAKAINFGIIYGISAFGLARNLGIGRGEAQDYIDAYFEKFPGIQRYMDETKDLARRQGFVSTLFGRKVHIQNIKDSNFNKRGGAERQAINAPIQGTAADVIRRAMIRLPDAIAAKKLDAKMLLQVHDELVFEVPESQADDLIALAKDVMVNAPEPVLKLDVPLVVDAGKGMTWDEAH